MCQSQGGLIANAKLHFLIGHVSWGPVVGQNRNSRKGKPWNFAVIVKLWVLVTQNNALLISNLCFVHQVRKDVDDCYAMAVALQQAAGESVNTRLALVDPDNPVARKQYKESNELSMAINNYAISLSDEENDESETDMDFADSQVQKKSKPNTFDDMLSKTVKDYAKNVTSSVEENEASQSDDEYTCTIEDVILPPKKPEQPSQLVSEHFGLSQNFIIFEHFYNSVN